MNLGILDNLGPLAAFAGAWEGDAGVDIAPAPSGTRETRYRERLSFDPFGPVTNGSQILYGLRYTTIAWPLDEAEPFHEETGYWLWDAERELVMRCFMVPRGVTVLAGGEAAADAREFDLSAKCGSETFGILSNPFLDRAFKTIRYDLTVIIHDDHCFSYNEDTWLVIPGQPEPFHHTDRNDLTRADQGR